MNSRWAGKWTLITGASAGIGIAFAEALAAGKSNLVLTARRMDRLQQLEGRLRAQHGIEVHSVPADLGRLDGPNDVFRFTEMHGIEVDFLINNAGYGVYGRFHEEDRARQVGEVQVNCASVVSLTHLYVPGMVQRRRGDILILASTAAFQAVPYMAVYAATKAFDLFLAEGLAQELKPYGVRVCALCPGATESEFADVSGAPTGRAGRNTETAEKVVQVGLKAMAAGKHYVISGTGNQFGAHVQRLVPRGLVTRMAEKIFRPKVGSQGG